MRIRKLSSIACGIWGKWNMPNKWFSNIRSLWRELRSVEGRKEKPRWSTNLAALYLSLSWTGAFILVFFVSTWAMDLETHVVNFFLALWLSIIAEAYIRWLENSDGVALWSKPLIPEAKGDNQDFTASQARGVVMFGIIALLLPFVILYKGKVDPISVQEALGTFRGLNVEGKHIGYKCMISSWVGIILSTKFLLGLIVCIGMRAYIYRRLPRTPDGQEVP